MEPTLQNILDSHLQWIFVGGKGGVGKTTTSCSLATLLATTPITITDATTQTTTTRPRHVLIISTDPAHNLSDAFDQKLGKEPTPIRGMDNLHGMEIDPTGLTTSEFFGGGDNNNNNIFQNGTLQPEEKEGMAAALKVLKQAISTLPGVDEVTVFAQIIKQVQQMSFDVVIFDTAPTGHTLRLLALPQTLNETMDSLFEAKGLTTLLSAASAMITASTGKPMTDFSSKLEEWRGHVKEVQRQFTDGEKTAFVCVCIPEFLSVYETERLIQELMKYNINCENIVVNQLVQKMSTDAPCRMCEARMKIQHKYLEQINELYEDFHVIKMPLHGDEVRGVAALQRFGKHLVNPYDVDKDGYL